MPVRGVKLDKQARERYPGRQFSPDALWQGSTDLTVYFKYVPDGIHDDAIGTWRREVWNSGFAPLLWLVSPSLIKIYNGFGQPQQTNDAQRHLVRTFKNIDSALNRLDALAGRIAMETGHFWQRSPKISRRTSVDQQLLTDLAALESHLTYEGLCQNDAQDLIGRSIFIKYLSDRGIISTDRLKGICQMDNLLSAFRDPTALHKLHTWLTDVFNGDVFGPLPKASIFDTRYISHIADFFQGISPSTGQMTFFPYQFDVIPVELISAIYEQFAHTSSQNKRMSETSAKKSGVYYTPTSLVSLVLDEVMDDISGSESVLDLTCGSGVFLVESLRRLISVKALHSPPSRNLIRSTLREQIYGVDKSERAVRVAALSLSLAALDLDPDPSSLEDLTFDKLVGNNLFVGDARSTAVKRRIQRAFVEAGKRVAVDIVVGNPPWTFKGKSGTEARKRGQQDSALLQPRGESLDFVQYAMELSDSRTRYGLVLSATAFFGRSKSSAESSRFVIDSLSPVVLVNLSNLSSWLFRNASMPAVALFGKCRNSTASEITAVQIPWYAHSSKSRTFEISPSDIVTTSVTDWHRNPALLKASFLGYRRDMHLVDRMMTAHKSLEVCLRDYDTSLKAGVILGDRSSPSDFLNGLPWLQTPDLRPFTVPRTLVPFREETAERPRERSIFRSPLLLVKAFLRKEQPRVVSAVADHDTVFTEAHFGASFSHSHRTIAHIIAGILSSSVASWYFLMTSSNFGLWMRKLYLSDINVMPIPDLTKAITSPAGQNVIEIVTSLKDRSPEDSDWNSLDQAVIDLYDLDVSDRTVVNDGLFRASGQWQAGRIQSVQPADTDHLVDYAQVFLRTIGAWLSVLKRRSMYAEIFQLPQRSPLRVVRFVLDDSSYESDRVTVIHPEGSLNQILADLGSRLDVRLADSLIGRRELRVYGQNEVVMIKPCARRHWLGVAALEDADTVIAESIA